MMLTDREAIMSSGRAAGLVRRWHTWFRHQEQTVAEHSWQMLRIYYQIWGRPEGKVTDYLVWHDTPEIATGDMPFPIKRDNPVLKEEADRIEKEQLKRLGGPSLDGLTDAEKLRVKFCDCADMMEYGVSEMMMGNNYAKCIAVDMRRAAEEYASRMSPTDNKAALKFLSVSFMPASS